MFGKFAQMETANTEKKILVVQCENLPLFTRMSVHIITGGCDIMISQTCIVAQTLSLLSPPVEPDAEAHKDDPTGPSNTGNKSRLFDHISDLFCDAVVPVSMYNHVPKFFTCRHKDEE